MQNGKHFRVILLGILLLEHCVGGSIFRITNYTTVVQNHGALTTNVKVATVASGHSQYSAVPCMTQCLQQVACRHVHSTASTCYLLGSDALIGQDTAHTLQPSDLIYTRDPTGTNCRNVHFAETKIIIVNIKVLGTCF